MLLRIRWFIMGAVASASVLGYLANQVRKARERLTVRSLTNSGMRTVARAIDGAASAVQPDPKVDR